MRLHFLLDIFQLIFPKTCFACQNVLLRNERILCLKCYLNLPKHINTKNKHQLELSVNGKNYKVYSKYKYQKKSNIQYMILHLKYNNRKDIGLLLGKELYQKVNHLKDIYGIVPVPLNPLKEKLRGYNQCIILAQGLNQKMKCKILTKNLMRVENNESQTLKTRYQRFENIDGIFTLNHKEHLEYKHIILIDDVYTSGATISGCIQVLSHVKGITISIVCIAS